MPAARTAWLIAGAVVLAGSGCAFRVNAGGEAADAAVDVPLDAPVPAFCDPAGGDLVACFQLEGSVEDESGNSLALTTSGVTFVSGKRGMAAHIEGASSIQLAETSLLDPTAITMEAWINPGLIPVIGARAGIVDNNGQYGFFVQPDGALQCIGLTAPANLVAGVWTHVACTYDGTTRLYARGVEVGATAGGGGPLGSGGTTGTSIAADNPSGSPLNGDIDQVRIFKRARTAAEICAAAGLAVCP